jgi:hypothetical protein
MRSQVEPKNLPTAHHWELLRCTYFKELGYTEHAEKLQALADWYLQKILSPDDEEQVQ